MGSHDHDHGHGHGDCENTPLTSEKKHIDDDNHDKEKKEDKEDDVLRKAVLRRLHQAVILCSCFLVVEVVGGWLAHSLAILSDAAHLFADLASFAVAIAASHLASLPATRQHTFGLKRTESLAALFSMVSLAFVSLGLAYEAIARLVDPPDELVNGKVMSGVAAMGVVVNVALAIVLGEDHVHMPGAHSHDHGDHCDSHGSGGGGGDDHHGHGDAHAHEPSTTVAVKGDYQSIPTTSHQSNGGGTGHEVEVEAGHSHGHTDHANCTTSTTTPTTTTTSTTSHEEDHAKSSHEDRAKQQQQDQRNINLRAAYLHVMGDLAQSVAVLVAGCVIWVRPEWHIIDPILTLGFAMLVLYSTTGVLRSSIAVLLEETPANISWQRVFEAISSVPNVHNVHDLHIWCISHGQPTLSVHCSSTDPKALLNIRNQCLAFGISHATIQIQQSSSSPSSLPLDYSCVTCGDETCCTAHLT